MTAGTVDYPEVFSPSDHNRTVDALERIATALETLVLNQMPASPSETNAGRSDIQPWDLPPSPAGVAVAQPYQAPVATTTIHTPAPWQCPVHHTVKVVPAGISKRTGASYDAFLSCTERDCQQKPPR